jgi:transcriptional regulator with XRE-family HTH domain
MQSVKARAASKRPVPNPTGVLLREWRAAKRLSQLDLALEAGVSARHLSCVETGKAQPSRDMIALLADALAMPLRERNALLVAAGYAPHYAETGLDAAALRQVRVAIDCILGHQEPFPAFLLNRRWDVLQTNRAAVRVNDFLGAGRRHANMVRRFLDPDDLRRFVVNWEEIAGDLIRHLHEAIAAAPSDAGARALLEEALGYPGVPAHWRTRDVGAPPPPLLTVVFRKADRELRFFSTITTFATPRDVTVDEIRIECAFPADESTAELCRLLARDDVEGLRP